MLGFKDIGDVGDCDDGRDEIWGRRMGLTGDVSDGGIGVEVRWRLFLCGGPAGMGAIFAERAD